MAKRVLLLTGAPGVGKTTVLLKVVDALKTKGVAVGGMVSREVRENGLRVGFEILDLSNGKRGWLAHVNQQTGPQVGKYRVNLQDLENIGAKAIAVATEEFAVIVIDEIGPMEFYSPEFKNSVKQALETTKPVVAVAHAKANDPLLVSAKQRSDAEVFVVTVQNREELADILATQILSLVDYS